jgi:hypothetical protein
MRATRSVCQRFAGGTYPAITLAFSVSPICLAFTARFRPNSGNKTGRQTSGKAAFDGQLYKESVCHFHQTSKNP